MMLTPCWPSAGPTGGAGLALPAWIWSLTTARTFLAMLYVLCPARVRDTRAPSPIHARGGGLWDDSSLQALHLEQVQLDRRLASEEGDEHAHLALGRIDAVHLAVEVLEGTIDDAYGLTDLERHFDLGL